MTETTQEERRKLMQWTRNAGEWREQEISPHTWRAMIRDAGRLARAEELLREAWGVIAYFDQDDPRVEQIRTFLSGDDDND